MEAPFKHRRTQNRKSGNQYFPKWRGKILLGGLIWEGGRASVLEPSDLVLKSDSIILAL